MQTAACSLRGNAWCQCKLISGTGHQEPRHKSCGCFSLQCKRANCRCCFQTSVQQTAETELCICSSPEAKAHVSLARSWLPIHPEDLAVLTFQCLCVISRLLPNILTHIPREGGRGFLKGRWVFAQDVLSKHGKHCAEEEAGKDTSLDNEEREAGGQLKRAKGKPSPDLAAPSGSGFCWLEQANGPPASLGLSTSLKQRTYYSGFVKVGDASAGRQCVCCRQGFAFSVHFNIGLLFHQVSHKAFESSLCGLIFASLRKLLFPWQ